MDLGFQWKIEFGFLIFGFLHCISKNLTLTDFLRILGMSWCQSASSCSTRWPSSWKNKRCEMHTRLYVTMPKNTAKQRAPKIQAVRFWNKEYNQIENGIPAGPFGQFWALSKSPKSTPWWIKELTWSATTRTERVSSDLQVFFIWLKFSYYGCSTIFLWVYTHVR